MVGFKGANPGGGGIELLSRLAGRSRALEVVLGADRIDADTAALYGCM
jgi:enoyl-CoA hydratase/carnithine racemase